MNPDDDPTTYAILESSRFWVQKVLVPITVGIGVAGNTITVMVLTRRRMRSSTNTYLTALAIADIIHLFFVFLLSFKHYSNIHDGKYAFYWRFHGLSYWLCDAASSTSIWLTVSFTVERYIAVCHPIRGKYFCTERRAKNMIVIIYIFCILTTASTTFEYQLSLNETCIDEGKSDLNISQKIGKSYHNGSTTHHYTLDHTIMHSKKSSSENLPSYPILNDDYLSQLKKITLSNCTSNPCIICILHILQPLNMTKEKMTNATLIENQVLASEATLITMPETEEMIQENVLEKPPSEAETLNSSIDLNDNKTELTSDNTTCEKIYMIDVESTKLGQNQTYLTFMYWYSAIFFYLLPLALIATFNCFLVRAVYLSQKMRRTMTNSQESISISNEKRITLMLIAVVVVFIICHTPTASMLIYKNFHISKNAREENIKLRNFFNFLVEVNASFNFLLYCVLSKTFRSTFKQIFFERRKKRQDTIMLSSTKSKNSQKFNPYKHGLMRRNASEYHTPRNLETQSLTSIPRSKSLMTRPVGKAKSTDLVV